MGDEQIQQPEEQQEQEEESYLIKHLRQKLEEKSKKEKELKQEVENLKQFLKIANIDELLDKVKKIDKLEFELALQKKFPDLTNEAEKIWETKKENENLEDVVARYLGKKQLENLTQQNVGFSFGSEKNYSTPIQETSIEDLEKLPLEQLRKLAQEEFK